MAFLGTLDRGQSEGEKWGQSLSGLLQNLAQGKAQQLQGRRAQQQKSAFWEQAGLEPQFAQALANQPEAIQKSFLDRLEGLQIPSQQQQGYYQPSMQQELPAQRQQLEAFREQVRSQDQMVPRDQAQERALRSLQYGQEAQQLGYTPIDQAGLVSQRKGEVPVIPPKLPTEGPEIKTGLRLGASPLDRRQQQQMAHTEMLQEKKLAQQRELMERKEKHELSKRELDKFDKEQKESKDYLKEINKKDSALKENDARLDRMDALNRGGKMNSSTFSSFLDTLSHGLWGVGINLKGLQSADTQEFEKLSKDMLNGMSEIFGSRILATEVENFLQTIPNLAQSPNGRTRVIDNLKMFNEAKHLRAKTAREIVKENDGKVPADLEIMTEERMDPILDKWAQDFKNIKHENVEPEEEFIKGPLGFEWRK